MKASKSRRASPIQFFAVAAPVGWKEMFKKDPEGPEIQAFLDGALAQAEASLRRAPKRGNSTRRRASGESGVRDVVPAASALTKRQAKVPVKRDETTKVVKSRQKRRKKS